MQAVDVATFFQASIKKLRRRKDLPEIKFWRPLYDRALKQAVLASRNDRYTITQVVKYGFRQSVSRVVFDPSDITTSAKNQIFIAWVRYRPNMWNLFSDYSYSAVAVLIRGNEAFITYTLTTSMTHPSMRRETNPSSILRTPLVAQEEPATGIFDTESLQLISESAQIQLNIALLPMRCCLYYDDHLKRLADYYCREARDFGAMGLENCRMATTVFEIDVMNLGYGEVGFVVAKEILRRLRIEDGCMGAYGGIGVTVGDSGRIWVAVVCYGKSLYSSC